MANFYEEKPIKTTKGIDILAGATYYAEVFANVTKARLAVRFPEGTGQVRIYGTVDENDVLKENFKNDTPDNLDWTEWGPGRINETRFYKAGTFTPPNGIKIVNEGVTTIKIMYQGFYT